MVKKSAASGNGASRKRRTSAAEAAQDGPQSGAVAWGLGTMPREFDGEPNEAGASADTGFTTDNASGQPEPVEGDRTVIDGAAHVFTQGDWVLASEEVAGPAPSVTPPKRKTKKQLAAEAEAEDAQLTNMTSDLVHGVEALERLAEEIGALKEDGAEVMAGLKSKGYTPKIIRLAIRRRAMDQDTRVSEDSMLAAYEEALQGA